MDDPIFDPWGVDAEDAGAVPPSTPPTPPARAPRWRSPVGAPATLPQPSRTLPPAARDHLPGAAGLLRSIALPRLEEAARRLQAARHEAIIEDRLDAPVPTLRLLLRPWRGPWTEELSPPQGVLELSLEDGPASRVLVRVWLDPDSAEPADVARIPSSQVGTAWVERLALDFVERLLARA